MHITPRCKKHDVNLEGEDYKDNLGLVAYYKDGKVNEGFDIDLSYFWCPVYGKMVNDAAARGDWDEEANLELREDCRNDWYMIVTGDSYWEIAVDEKTKAWTVTQKETETDAV